MDKFEEAYTAWRNGEETNENAKILLQDGYEFLKTKTIMHILKPLKG